ncbi:hypothetical protein H6P81_017836 [Aristolochia fimbriata]|uniref:Uncharacterized protein n=1 Tax=Aristolochia fimbriata TaxID=158543 RepID=A0AAV7DZS2_ARIFI|nr:hypothetical protein H6P81_017836 [Aristolochia fimbriata]
MGPLSGIIRRPLVVVTAVGVVAVSSDIPDKLSNSTVSHYPSCTKPSDIHSLYSFKDLKSWLSQISLSNLSQLSFTSRIRIPIDSINYHTPNIRFLWSQNQKLFLQQSSATVASPPALVKLYRSVNFAQPPQPTEFTPVVSPPSEALYKWHLPKVNAEGISSNSDCLAEKAQTVVVLLGWLGAKQKHLKTYAEWYTSRGFHVVTFTFPMSDIISYNVGGKAEQNVGLLADHLASWVGEELGKKLVFHTFSNTGWLTYGAILEKFQKQDPSLEGKIKGCIVDSAPVASPDPQVWASGFSAAFLKKQSIATKGFQASHVAAVEVEELNGGTAVGELKPPVAEQALLVILEKFFSVVLNLPSVNRRLSDVLDTLTSEQPKCPQLYIYSSADRVIPAKSVESFIEEQRRAGHNVRACNFVFSPHVDHFRNSPELYTTQLTTFLEDCVVPLCKVAVSKS